MGRLAIFGQCCSKTCLYIDFLYFPQGSSLNSWSPRHDPAPGTHSPVGTYRTLSPASVGRAIRGPDQPQVPSTLLQVGTPRD